jgi:hypothetical protein
MVYDLYQTIMFLDNITKNKYLYKAIEKLDYLYSFLKLNKHINIYSFKKYLFGKMIERIIIP